MVDRRYMMFAVLLLVVGVVPLALVLLLTGLVWASDLGDVVWGAFSGAVAGVCALAFRAARPAISTLSDRLDDARMYRITVIVFFTVFGGLLSLGFVVLGASLGMGAWERMAYAFGSFLLLVLALRYIALPSGWEYYRAHWGDSNWTWSRAAAGTSTEFIGCPRDLQTRPEYYDEDVRWLVRLVRKRLTSASSRRGKR